MSINIKRAFSFALENFYRNKGISVSAIFVLILTILLATGLFFTQGMSNYLVESIKSKIDITAYFKDGTDEQAILDAKDQLSKQYPTITSITYVSKEDALASFNEKHAGDTTLSQALAEVGGNPFLPSLNIVTGGNSSQYEQIANFMQSQFGSILDSVDFSQKKATIDKVFSVTKSIDRVGLFLAVVLVIVALSVVFNTIKLIVGISKEEIATMKLVGASNWFIKAPFIIEGGIFGFSAFMVCFFITIAVVFALSPFVETIMPGFSLVGYFIAKFWLVILIQLFAGVGLGVISSFVVVRKYLKV